LDFGPGQPPPQNRCRRCLKNPTTLKPTAADLLPPPSKTQKNLCLRLYGYNDHDNLDHGYIMIGYLDIDIKNTVYSNSRTPSTMSASSRASTPLPL
jgi:hypothetical protein